MSKSLVINSFFRNFAMWDFEPNAIDIVKQTAMTYKTRGTNHNQVENGDILKTPQNKLQQTGQLLLAFRTVHG